MAEFKITRFRYTWTGNWDSNYSSLYNKDDVVFYQGSAWVCVRQHNPSVFADDQAFTSPGDTLPSPAWTKMSDGRKWLGNWQSSTQYDPGVLVVAGGNLYLCITAHQSSTNFNTNANKFEILATGSNFRNTWTANTRYQEGDAVRYNGYTYQCVLEHTSGSVSQGIIVGNNDGDDDSTAETWSVAVENYTYVGEYQTSTRYRKNDLVKYGGSILKCILEHTPENLITGAGFNNDYFETYLPGFKFDNVWSSIAQYAIGDVVRYGGVVYVASTNHTNKQPGQNQIYETGAGDPNWTVVTKGIDFRGEYDPQGNTQYQEGDIVRRGGALWVSLTNQFTDDSSLRALDTSNWQLVIAAQNIKGGWRDNLDYNLYDIVYFRGVTYYASTPHLSSFENFPGDNGSGNDYWTVLVIGDENNALTVKGDVLSYGLRRNILEDGSTQFTLGDGSTFGNISVPIGEEDQLLVVEDNVGNIGYKTWGNVARVFYVATDGVDETGDLSDPENPKDLNRGLNYFKPFRTVRYALENADDGFPGTTTINVRTGEYYEILPLIIPARTAVVGEELRSTTIRASEPIAALATDAEYTIETLTRIGTLLPNIIQGIPIIVSIGNTEPQSTAILSTGAAAALVDSNWASIINTIDYKVNELGSMPTVTGSNTLTTDSGRLTAVAVLEANREFIKAEAIAFMAVANPLYIFDTAKCRRDLDRFIDAVKYDLQYPGNYKSVLAGRYYANAVIGSQLEDMFYVRDTTGIRNLTLKGLEGTLPALTPGEIYSIPTGGAFVSLDPGWGPADERTWIINRSCYVQNVTTFGVGASGQKVDGSLHNGGNKSIVSNDFTQVISDGIGAWMLNGGRGELVSVFSYYAHIGMFAMDGGIIRATNGNSSYGDFGAVADGIDPNEIVRYGYVNTQTEQAVVAAAYAGEILDYILGLEFSNCGQNYTTASYTITSSGSGARAIQEEFRDNSMFECQVLNGGTGFTQRGNQAQTGGPLSITLASAESTTEAQILGMRILIISGEGTGQYAYVQAYNPATKICTVYRESDNLPGWDHVLPGTPSAPLLTTGTRYRIEPRPTFSEPSFTASVTTMATAGAWAAAAYGETSQTFTDVTGTVGTGTTVDVTPASAIFTVVKTGRTYSITQTNGGAGYAVGDTITIRGNNVGGINVEHDIVLTVTDVSDDSTNSILSYTIADPSLIAASGKFILTPSSGHFGRYSSDGETWTTFDLPTEGNWKCLAAGNNRFVAISYGSSDAASSTNGIDWTAQVMPASRNWSGVVYGKPSTASTGIFVAVADNLNSAAYSIDGIAYAFSSLPTFGDSTLNEYVDVAFGSDVFVAVANSSNIAAVGTWNGTSLSWQGTILDVVADSSQKDWVSVTYGNRRFVAISSTGDVAYSFDGLSWFPATMPSQDGSTAHNWKQIRYGQGVFFAVGDTGSKTVGAEPTTGPTTYAATSYDGIVWTERTLASELEWGVVAFGNPDITLNDSTLSNNKPTWIAAPSASSLILNKIYTGARALGRVVLGGVTVGSIKIWEPGSGYDSDPILTITDPNNTVDPTFRPRLADGVLAQPTFVTKGVSYKTSTTSITVTGDGFADKTPVGKFITLDGLTVMPGPGAQFYIAGSTSYRVAVLVGINEELLPNGTIRSTFQISPASNLAQFIEHGMEVVIREKYSQVRITGHDFLDIGSGNFEETNYPVLYKNYDFTTEPQQEVQNLNGGRVFYTSTDQDGNFRAGEQFAVEQSTGIITIAAEFFDLAGLTELRLAGINVGSTAVIREFSKDGLFLQNSNNIIPTQRAVRTYLQSRLNVGGEDLLTPSVTAGTVKIGPTSIESSASLSITVPVVADFSGNASGLSNGYVAQTMFYRSMRLT
jgi:hypothetical protein